jgi:hypothetical protein
MSLSAVYASNVPLRATLKTVAFLCSFVFFVFAGLGAYLAKKCFW